MALTWIRQSTFKANIIENANYVSNSNNAYFFALSEIKLIEK